MFVFLFKKKINKLVDLTGVVLTLTRPKKVGQFTVGSVDIVMNHKNIKKTCLKDTNKTF